MSSSRRRWTGVDAVVHLAGAGVGDHRWTPAYKQQIFASRVDSTHTVASALAELAGRGQRPVLVSGSAIGIYGPDRGEEVLTEASPAGQGFLCDVVRAWEAASKPAEDAGLRVVHARTGLVLSPARRRDGPGAAPGPARAGRTAGVGPSVLELDHPAGRGPCPRLGHRPADADRARST